MLSFLRRLFRPKQVPTPDADTPLDFVESGKRLNVSSSWVSYARYDLAMEELEIGFRGGWVEYYRASPEVARSFAAAPSKGRWVWENIFGGFQKDGRHWVHKLPRRL